MLFSSESHKYPDDIFEETRMSFGDHLEELRYRMLKALKGFIFFLLIGFALDLVGDQIGYRDFGIGRPMLAMIKDPVESQVRDFYSIRNERAVEKLRKLADAEKYDPEELAALRKRIGTAGLSDLSPEEKRRLLGTPEEMPVVIPVEPFSAVFGPPRDPNVKEIEAKIRIYPAHVNYLSNKGEGLLENKQHLSTLSVQEGMVVYLKVSMMCGAVLASPWVFYHIWAFVAAGMYPHERAYVHKFLWPSVTLFVFGVLLCQFLVLPGAVRALLAFNLWIDMDPEIRLNEWLSFAILLPLVFGVAFQTPLIMVFLNRIGIFGWEDYWAKWRYAVLFLAFVSAVVVPTPDAVTMLYLFLPLFALYMLGVLVCKYLPPRHSLEESAADEQVAV